ncbi:hypothetical protein BDQ12DRAFT_666313 [Crucibulum laeve]|uniref:Uncharacterized protein n=1 Tax=Crucibulum laeve TaxID=68775 RepID=A0A5C3M1S1_9AGAR|nr:hypothetical protein BDQ12DRAFT_666313 [Crucibulum laeve]
MPGAVISNATRIWELNVHWALYSQCGVWDPRGRGVDIWECIRDHDSTPGTQVYLLQQPVHPPTLSGDRPLMAWYRPFNHGVDEGLLMGAPTGSCGNSGRRLGGG